MIPYKVKIEIFNISSSKTKVFPLYITLEHWNHGEVVYHICVAIPMQGPHESATGIVQTLKEFHVSQ